MAGSLRLGGSRKASRKRCTTRDPEIWVWLSLSQASPWQGDRETRGQGMENLRSNLVIATEGLYGLGQVI